MFEYFLNKQIKLNDIIKLLFGVDGGDDQPCVDILDGWLGDEELYTKFKNKESAWSSSPDLGAFEIEVIGNKVLITTEVGVLTEYGDINSDLSHFYINIDKSNIYKFVFLSDTLEEV